MDNMRLYRLTISKYLDRKGLAIALKKIFTTTSPAELLKIVDNLPYINEDMWTEKDLINSILSGHCEFVYEQIPFPGNSDPNAPPWESPEYFKAKFWYDNLPEEDRKKVDILRRASMPWA